MLKRLSIQKDKVKKLLINGINVNYIPFKTNDIPNKSINNSYFHIDIYDNVFFFYKKNINLPGVLDVLFDNKKLYLDTFYIPNAEFEYFLLLLRVAFDLGKLRDKHKNRLIKLIPVLK